MKIIILSVWRTMRTRHWIKNIFVFAPLFFAGEAKDPLKLAITFLVFIAFSLLSSSIYFLNDLFDRERDRSHPEKCKRPIAAGSLSVWIAVISGILLAVVSISISLFISFKVALVLFSYGCINILYSMFVKHVVILDVFCIASGFVLRVLAGGFANDIEMTSWLIIATFLLALFLGLAKRRNELVILDKSANNHRPVLDEYTLTLVDQLVSVVTPVTLITYLLYTLDPVTINKFHSDILYVTGTFVVFGIFRYLYLVHKKDAGGSPTDLVFKDVPLLLSIIGWVLTFFFIVYFA